MAESSTPLSIAQEAETPVVDTVYTDGRLEPCSFQMPQSALSPGQQVQPQRKLPRKPRNQSQQAAEPRVLWPVRGPTPEPCPESPGSMGRAERHTASTEATRERVFSWEANRSTCAFPNLSQIWSNTQG
ncbi:unnamed protein product [Lota lota]